jgi:hypothetical protein
MYSMLDGRMEGSLHKADTHFFLTCEGSWYGCLCHLLYGIHKPVLTTIWLDVVDLGNDVTVVVNCYDVVSPSVCCFGRDINECYSVDEFVCISKLELRFVRLAEIAYCLLTVFKIQR